MSVNDDLPFTDEAHVRAIAAALWRRRGRGSAAVMVGAGFSANSVPLGGDPIPLWSGLVSEMGVQLYGDGDDAGKTVAAVGSLRIAEEYTAAFGRPALDRLVIEKIADTRFEPGHLHKRLLDLPWADVFTTNWDTLLERASVQVLERSYDVIRTVSEIPRSAPPRIVKLHGSLPSNTPFIFTEEDFRTYPTRFAPFVNLAQQSMMENVFCLIGFSGDDPNFLYWSGWVRDHLGIDAPRIYLVGWLSLTQARRKMLEDRNVIPVDLSKLRPPVPWPDALRHSYALEWFLRSLRQAEPPRAITWPHLHRNETWPEHLPRPAGPTIPKPDVNLAIALKPDGNPAPIPDALATARSWHTERRRYPGWLVAPDVVREPVWMYTCQHLGSVLPALNQMEPGQRLFIASELNWRMELCLIPMPMALRSIYEAVLDATEALSQTQIGTKGFPRGWDPVSAWIELALACLRSHREHGDHPGLLAWADRLTQRAASHAGASDFIQYELCLSALERLDHRQLEAALASWAEGSSDPIWMVRKAAVLAEFGSISSAQRLVASALIEIRRRTRKDVDDLQFLSREGWALKLHQACLWTTRFGQEPDFWDRMARLEQCQCDPQSRLEEIKNALTQERSKAPGTRERLAFDAGTVTVTTSVMEVDPWLRALPALRARRLAEIGGVPSHIANSVLANDLLRSAAGWLSPIMPQAALSLALRCCGAADDEELDGMFSRAIVAKTGEAEAADLMDRIQASIERVAARLRASGNPLDPDTQHADRQMVATTQILSRFCLRVPSKAGSVFELALKYCRDDGLLGQSWVLLRECMRLADRAVEAMTELERNERALELFALPLPEEHPQSLYYSTGGKDPCLRFGSHRSLPARSSDPEGWKSAVEQLTDAVATHGLGRIVAIQRLQMLQTLHLLSPEEQTKLAGVLWASIPHEFQHPETFGVPSSAFLRLPELQSGQAVALFRSAMLTAMGPLYVGLTDDRFFETISFACRWASGESRGPIELTPSECSLVLGRVEKWLLSSRPSGQSAVTANHRDAGPAVIGAFLDAILPSIEPGSAVSDRALAAIDRMTTMGCRTQLLSHWVAHLSPEKLPQVIERLCVSANSTEAGKASLAMIAIRLWVTAGSTGRVASLPPGLAELVMITVASERPDSLTAALDAAAVLVQSGAVPDGSRFHTLLLEALSALLSKATYGGAMEKENERLSIADIRAGCVRLSHALAKRGVTGAPVADWQAVAPIDPLPEVREAALAFA